MDNQAANKNSRPDLYICLLCSYDGCAEIIFNFFL